MVQSLTPFRHVGRHEEPPLTDIVGLAPVERCARALGLDVHLVRKVIELTDSLFAGRLWHYQAIDVRYHDLQHSAQASCCLLGLAEGCRRADSKSLSTRDIEIALAAVLLHDSGFIKADGDDRGTGAKYTHSHVLRSCALAASLLPPLGFHRDEVEDVVGMIRCTGLSGKVERSSFSSDSRLLLACMVATADFLGQMAAPEYPEKLPFLFAEFEEADDFSLVPRETRMFRSVEQLLGATGGFWRGFVLPRLESEFRGVYHYLEAPGGAFRRNPYVEAVERNIAIISGRLR